LNKAPTFIGALILYIVMRSGLKLVGMIGKTMIATLGENHAEGFSMHVNYCNKESLHRPLQLTMSLRITKNNKRMCWCVVKVFLWLMDRYHNRKCLKLTIPRYRRNTPTLRLYLVISLVVVSFGVSLGGAEMLLSHNLLIRFLGFALVP
jgi:hypothetical protein